MKKSAREDLPRPQKKKARRIVLWTLLGLVLAGLGLGGWHAYRILKQPASLFSEAPAATAVPQATILAPAFPVHTAVPTRVQMPHVLAQPHPVPPAPRRLGPAGRQAPRNARQEQVRTYKLG